MNAMTKHEKHNRMKIIIVISDNIIIVMVMLLHNQIIIRLKGLKKRNRLKKIEGNLNGKIIDSCIVTQSNK